MTAQIEIKTLAVHGRQLTRGLYRQIVDFGRWLSAPDPDLTMWGTVNYHHPAGECPAGQHLHVVGVKGGEPRRATVEPPSPRKMLALGIDGCADIARELRDLPTEDRAAWCRFVKRNADQRWLRVDDWLVDVDALRDEDLGWTAGTGGHRAFFGSNDGGRVLWAPSEQDVRFSVNGPKLAGQADWKQFIVTPSSKLASTPTIDRAIKDGEMKREQRSELWDLADKLPQLFVTA